MTANEMPLPHAEMSSTVGLARQAREPLRVEHFQGGELGAVCEVEIFISATSSGLHDMNGSVRIVQGDVDGKRSVGNERAKVVEEDGCDVKGMA